MDPLASFTYDTFSGRVGETFAVPDAEIELTLALVEAAHGVGAREGGSFSLFFHGPAERLLLQQTQRIVHPELGEFGLFLVPVGRTADGFEYEAVFN